MVTKSTNGIGTSRLVVLIVGFPLTVYSIMEDMVEGSGLKDYGCLKLLFAWEGMLAIAASI
jgi:hypothetical protein